MTVTDLCAPDLRLSPLRSGADLRLEGRTGSSPGSSPPPLLLVAAAAYAVAPSETSGV